MEQVYTWFCAPFKKEASDHADGISWNDHVTDYMHNTESFELKRLGVLGVLS